MSSDPHATGHDAHESHTCDAKAIKELAPDEPKRACYGPLPADDAIVHDPPASLLGATSGRSGRGRSRRAADQ